MKATEKMKTVKRASQEKKKTRTRDQGELDVNDAISHTLKKKRIYDNYPVYFQKKKKTIIASS